LRAQSVPSTDEAGASLIFKDAAADTDVMAVVLLATPTPYWTEDHRAMAAIDALAAGESLAIYGDHGSTIVTCDAEGRLAWRGDALPATVTRHLQSKRRLTARLKPYRRLRPNLAQGVDTD
jgi:hypothetical protein